MAEENKPPLAYRKLDSKTRATIEQRQGENGYRDIDGLQQTLAEHGYQGDGYSRSTAGDINVYLQRAARRIKEKQAAMTAVFEALGPQANDIGLVNVALIHDAIQGLMEKLELESLDLSELEPTQRLAAFIQLTKAQLQASQSVKPLKNERRQDKEEAEKQKQKAADAIADMVKRETGVSDDTAEDIRKKVLRLNV